jgi:hypothetical protein
MEDIQDLSAWEQTVNSDTADPKTKQNTNLPSVTIHSPPSINPPASTIDNISNVETKSPCSEIPEDEMFGIIDVCSSRQLFDTFRAELLAADSFSFAVAVDRERTPPAAATAAVTEECSAVSEEARGSSSSSSTDLCRVDSGVIGNFSYKSLLYNISFLLSTRIKLQAFIIGRVTTVGYIIQGSGSSCSR